MSESHVCLIYAGQHHEDEIRTGLSFQALVAKHPDLPLEFDCRKADCGVCLIKVVEGAEHLSVPTTAEKDFLKAMHAQTSERLACQCRIMGAVTVEVPQP